MTTPTAICHQDVRFSSLAGATGRFAGLRLAGCRPRCFDATPAGLFFRGRIT
jgi:hypothetical protein